MPEKSFRIVVADDEGVIRMGLKAILRNLGHRVVGTARNGKEAIAKVDEFRPDLLLLDIKMPEMDGLAVAEYLTSHAPLPILMLTAFSEHGLVERAANALVMGYLVKPINEAKLAPMISVAVARFAERAATNAAADTLQQKLTARDTISAAKQTLMAQGLSEDEAYHRLQSMARTNQTTIAAVADVVLRQAAR